jgi:hypothetical protein
LSMAFRHTLAKPATVPDTKSATNFKIMEI